MVLSFCVTGEFSCFGEKKSSSGWREGQERISHTTTTQASSLFNEFLQHTKLTQHALKEVEAKDLMTDRVVRAATALPPTLPTSSRLFKQISSHHEDRRRHRRHPPRVRFGVRPRQPIAKDISGPECPDRRGLRHLHRDRKQVPPPGTLYPRGCQRTRHQVVAECRA